MPTPIQMATNRVQKSEFERKLKNAYAPLFFLVIICFEYNSKRRGHTGWFRLSSGRASRNQRVVLNLFRAVFIFFLFFFFFLENVF